MNLSHTSYTIAEIRDQLSRKDLVVNPDYQRSSDIWPSNAQSYFIDTILEGYPFPKVYFYESYDEKKKLPRREIVDGQQRVSTAVSFANNEFKLTSASKNFKGLNFKGLDPSEQRKFLMTPMQADLILSAERAEVLEMFRRINAYTAPLNDAEKRHAIFQGEFKWFINKISDKYSPLLEAYGVFTEKQLVRMADAEFFTELALVLDQGIINKSSKSLKGIYEKFNEEFKKKERFEEIISDFFNTLQNSLVELHDTFMMKSYVLLSLFSAMTQQKYGIPDGEQDIGKGKSGFYFKDKNATIKNLKKLAYAHETQDTEGKYKKYVDASLSTTHRIAQRKIRAQYIARALA
jgi:hypothetical protein